jgi:hypothetical protein
MYGLVTIIMLVVGIGGLALMWSAGPHLDVIVGAGAGAIAVAAFQAWRGRTAPSNRIAVP